MEGVAREERVDHHEEVGAAVPAGTKRVTTSRCFTSGGVGDSTDVAHLVSP